MHVLRHSLQAVHLMLSLHGSTRSEDVHNAIIGTMSESQDGEHGKAGVGVTVTCCLRQCCAQACG